jgi:ATP-binding cassette, subfamily C (CFTR/MRP), member 1
MRDSVSFSKLMEEYGNHDSEEKTVEKETDEEKKMRDKKKDQALMQDEDRETGAVSMEVYRKYLKAAGGVVWAPMLLLLLVLTQAAAGECERSENPVADDVSFSRK